MVAVVVLAGGEGRRIRAYAKGRPKALVPILDKPFLQWKVDELRKAGASRIILVAGSGSPKLFRSLHSIDSGLPIAVLNETSRPRGTAKALRVAHNHLDGSQFILTYGDNLLEFPLRRLTPTSDHNSATMVVGEASRGPFKANVSVNPSGRVLSYSSAPMGYEENYFDYGYTFFPRGILENYAWGLGDLSDVFAYLISSGRLRALITEARLMEIGTPARLRKARQILRRKKPW